LYFGVKTLVVEGHQVVLEPLDGRTLPGHQFKS
jgi:hypothetical protein